jgi:hypothetical protein
MQQNGSPQPHGNPHLGDATHVEDMKLLHFWILKTAPSLVVGDEYVRIWQDYVVKLSFDHPFLLSGIFAVVSLHKAHFEPQNQAELILQSSTYLSHALEGFRCQLADPTAETVVPIFALACLLVVHSLGIARFQPPEDPVAALLDLAQLIRGSGTATHGHWKHFCKSEMALLARSAAPDPNVGEDNAELLELRCWISESTRVRAEDRDIYLEAMDRLHIVFRNVQHSAKQTRSRDAIMLSWLAAISSEFLAKLTAKDSIALIVFAYFAVLFRWQENAFWVQGWAEMVSDAIEEQLGPEDRVQIEWPRSVVQLDTSISSG